MSDIWLSTLITSTPQTGYDLAIKLSRMAVKMTQPDADIREKLRPSYAGNAGNAADLIAISHIVAINFQTVSAANGYWDVDTASMT